MAAKKAPALGFKQKLARRMAMREWKKANPGSTARFDSKGKVIAGTKRKLTQKEKAAAKARGKKLGANAGARARAKKNRANTLKKLGKIAESTQQKQVGSKSAKTHSNILKKVGSNVEKMNSQSKKSALKPPVKGK